ncbi:hypothetical protein VOLCADRAFT_86693 [Volvox carteri f. nagariensis]|uniref:Uncharacterized protein n=1 Tax=Volvox carteri f. nagariensis TaxID=3068 RepID=D8TJC6_VOLCA|nr:uncharacterized protein VOLCADRAFT_86693 [Volvox carteri f. nagariensis]EFJ52348.1 hypothetical protein VOLCADRAFT_86693 [Volvox carteri f. nagariensis]|eukprot:XP_002946421.1 hypothetical protein VOLCADRAFT_86693 [Volvox carteri f. nagariensis]
MDELLSTPIAVRLLQQPEARLHDFLVLDAYKPKMHVMYDKYLSGVTADFALVVRRAPPAADPARLPHERPALFASFEASAAALSRTMPYGPYEVNALRTQFGMELPQSLLERCHRDGVAPLDWQQRHRGGALAAEKHHQQQQQQQQQREGELPGNKQQESGRVAIASGPLVSASLMETPLMQCFQQLAVEAQVQVQVQAQVLAPSPPALFDRTERLANSLSRLVLTVQRINALRHGCRVALFAGRRASDLLYLVLQNLYCAAHLDGYDGTSSLYVVAILGREWTQMGVPERECWGGVGRLIGTHAHEQVSAVQQLLAPYDVEAGRRCGLPHGVAVTPLLAHLLFLAANGSGGADGGSATALADTLTTAAFLAVSRALAVPAAFRRDVEAAFGWLVPEHARCFDLFRVWRLDSGDYEKVAAQIIAAWEARCLELQAVGHPPLPRPHLMNSNLSSEDDIAAVCNLDPRVRPTTLAFGTLADGFLPFLDPEGEGEDGEGGKQAGTDGGGSGRPTMSLASVVMKLVQARPPRPLPSLSVSGDGGGDGGLPATAVKLGDGDGDGDSGKVQVDPRLEPEVAMAALRAATEMARGSATSALDSAAVSAVLAEAYDAVTRRGVLMAVPPTME